MNELTPLINALGGMDYGHLIIISVVLLYIVRPDLATKTRALITRSPAPTPATNGPKTDALKLRLDTHERHCDTRHQAIDKRFEEIFDAIGESIRLDDTTGAPCTYRPLRDNEFDFFRLDCICYHVYGGATPPFTMREYKRVPKVLHGLLPYKIAKYMRERIEADK